VSKYRKLPEEVEAIQWTGDNWWEITEFCPTCKLIDTVIRINPNPTNTGCNLADRGDFIVKEKSGFVYAIKENLFRETYEEINKV